MLTIVQTLLVFFLYILGAIVFGIALTPAIYCFEVMTLWLSWPGIFVHKDLLPLEIGIILGICFFVFGLSLMLTVGLLSLALNLRLKEGDHRLGSPQMLKWYFVNALFLGVRAVFMDFMMLTPLCALFYRMMGAKLGRNVQINSKNVADHCLLEIGDNSVIGGNATVIAHSFEPKGLRLARVRIGRNCIIGLNSVVMPGVTVGDNSVVAAGAIVPKGTAIEPDTLYYGPDRRVTRK